MLSYRQTGKEKIQQKKLSRVCTYRVCCEEEAAQVFYCGIEGIENTSSVAIANVNCERLETFYYPKLTEGRNNKAPRPSNGHKRVPGVV